MSIIKIVKQLQQIAINTPLVNQSAFGDIELYNNKATIKYPYVNYDIVSENVMGNVAQYTFRIYVCDRNPDPYIAYNKTLNILNSILKHPDVDASAYVAYYFVLNFKDQVTGCYADFIIEEAFTTNCLTVTGTTINFEMPIYQIINTLKSYTEQLNLVSEVGIGNIELYDNRATVKYPYINYELVSTTVTNYANRNIIRVRVLDRNEPYIAYNKTQDIMHNLLSYPIFDIENYVINYINLEYQDIVNGCYIEFSINNKTNSNCLINNDQTYIITETGDYVITEVSEDYIVSEN